MAFMRERNRQPELMDQPQLARPAHEAALRGLRRINFIGAAVPLIWKTLRPLARAATASRPLRILDLGSGGGDTAIRLMRRARQAGLPIIVDGCDRSPAAVEMAAASAADLPGIRFFRHDVLNDSMPGGYDVLLCSLFLHHFDEDDAVQLLLNMSAAARRGVLVDDLLRTTIGYGLCWVGCRILTRSPIVRVDGPLSVRAAFTLSEVQWLAARAGLSGATFRNHWPQRFLMTWMRE